MNKIIFLIIAMLTSSQGIAGDGTRGESGRFWCGQRFLPKGIDVFGQREEFVANRGYIYVLAAALTLQKKSNAESDAHHFYKPERLIPIDSTNNTQSGFQATTFLLKPLTNNEQEEIVVAFAGSNELKDWIKTNLSASRRQYNDARNYIIKTLKVQKIHGKKIIVTGISLGGGLAVHVTKDPLTSNYIKEAWAINPSPKIYAPKNIDKRIWLISSYKEILTYARDLPASFIVGSADIGAPKEQSGTDYNLVKSNSIYAHFRWVITREVLFAADFALTDKGRNLYDTEPFEIIKKSHFASCKI